MIAGDRERTKRGEDAVIKASVGSFIGESERFKRNWRELKREFKKERWSKGGVRMW